VQRSHTAFKRRTRTHTRDREYELEVSRIVRSQCALDEVRAALVVTSNSSLSCARGAACVRDLARSPLHILAHYSTLLILSSSTCIRELSFDWYGVPNEFDALGCLRRRRPRPAAALRYAATSPACACACTHEHAQCGTQLVKDAAESLPRPHRSIAVRVRGASTSASASESSSVRLCSVHMLTSTHVRCMSLCIDSHRLDAGRARPRLDVDICAPSRALLCAECVAPLRLRFLQSPPLRSARWPPPRCRRRSPITTIRSRRSRTESGSNQRSSGTSEERRRARDGHPSSEHSRARVQLATCRRICCLR
jgi:hypothetical protein